MSLQNQAFEGGNALASLLATRWQVFIPTRRLDPAISTPYGFFILANRYTFYCSVPGASRGIAAAANSSRALSGFEDINHQPHPSHATAACEVPRERPYAFTIINRLSMLCGVYNRMMPASLSYVFWNELGNDGVTSTGVIGVRFPFHEVDRGALLWCLVDRSCIIESMEFHCNMCTRSMASTFVLCEPQSSRRSHKISVIETMIEA